MTTEQRFEQMEAQVAALELRDARRESEHRSLLKTYEEMATACDKLRRDVDEDYELLGKAVDKRIDELKARAARAGGLSKEELLAGFGELADVVAGVDQRLYRFMASTVELLSDLVEGAKAADARQRATDLRITEIVRVADSRFCRLENLVRPALEGRAKIMAIEA